MPDTVSAEYARQLFTKIIQTDRLHRTVAETIVSSLGIHRSQHMILMYLSKQKKGLSQKQIADEFDISAAAVAVSIKKLQTGGFIEKNISEKDSRFNEIVLTDKGKEIVETTKRVFSKLDCKVFSDFTLQECKTLEKYLDKMQSAIKDLCDETRKESSL